MQSGLTEEKKIKDGTITVVVRMARGGRRHRGAGGGRRCVGGGGGRERGTVIGGLELYAAPVLRRLPRQKGI